MPDVHGYDVSAADYGHSISDELDDCEVRDWRHLRFTFRLLGALMLPVLVVQWCLNLFLGGVSTHDLSADQRRQAVNMWFIDGAVPAFDFVVVLYSLVATLDLDETVRARIRYREMKRLDEYDRTLARDSETKPGPEDAVYFQKSKKWKAIIVFNVFAFVFLLAGPIIFTIQQYAQHDLLGKEYYPLIIAVNCTSLVLYIALGAVCYTFYRDYGKWSKKAYKSLLASEKAYVAKERQKPKKLARKNWDKASGSTDDTDKSDQHDTKGKKTWR